jgi:hypothetical protein
MRWLIPILFCSLAHASWTLVAHGCQSGKDPALTLNAGGADLIVVEATCNDSSATCPAPTDSQNNAYTALGGVAQVSASFAQQMFYAWNANGASDMIITGNAASGYNTYGICAQAWSGSLRSSNPLDTLTSAVGKCGATTSCQWLSLTPNNSNELVVGSLGVYTSSGTYTASPLTVSDGLNYVSASAYAQAMAYQTQSTATKVQATWAWSESTPYYVGVLAAFQEASAAAPSLVMTDATAGAPTLICTMTPNATPATAVTVGCTDDGAAVEDYTVSFSPGMSYTVSLIQGTNSVIATLTMGATMTSGITVEASSHASPVAQGTW